jgi:long-chain acyl-CoA synthetase
MHQPWLRNYEKNVPVHIDTDKYPNLLSVLDETFQKYRNKPAFACMGKVLSFDEIDRYSRQFAAYLHSRGLVPGDKMAVMMPNVLQYPIVLFGALRAGVVIVNTNPLYTPREMKHQFNDSGAVAIVIIENFAYNLQEIIGETKIKTVIVASIGEMLGLKGILVNFVVRNVKKMVPKYQLENTVTVMDAIRQGKNFSIHPFESKRNDVVALQYTGGTTGVSKGAMLTNANLLANMQQMVAIMSVALVEGKEIGMCPLPLYHIYAFTVNCLGLFSLGGLNVLITNPRDIKGLIKDWKKYPVTITTGLNTLFNGLLNHPDFKTIDFSTLKISSGGGMAIQRVVAEKWKEVTGCSLSEGYGLTETSPVASCNPFMGTGKIGTIGIPVPSTDMRIVDDAGNILGIEDIGEIQIKGPQVMLGYYNRPEATAEMIKDGWLSTGDIGKMDSDGFFSIVDRKKDMILVSGFNVYPNEIEEVLSMHPKVLECAVIGIKDEKTTEAVKAFIVKRDKSLTDTELIAFCRENLTAYKVPKKIEFRDALPKSNVGKILRKELRE